MPRILTNASGTGEIYDGRRTGRSALAHIYRHPRTTAVTLKTTTLQPRNGSPDSWLLHKDSSTNAVSLHNPGLTTTLAIVSTLHSLPLPTKKPVIVSIFGTLSELLDITQRLGDYKGGPLWIEWNISCPNAQHPLDPASIPQLYPLLRARCGEHPLGIKVGITTPVYTSFVPSFVTAINTIGGVGGSVIRQRALTCIVAWRVAHPEIPIIGCGGATAASAPLYTNAGATIVSIGTDLLRFGLTAFNDPPRQRLVNIISSRRLTTKGPILLKSGNLSNTYINFRAALWHPRLFVDLIRHWSTLIRTTFPPFDGVCGVPTGATPWATGLAMCLGVPLAQLRTKPKRHGLRGHTSPLTPHSRILLVEDVVTTGGSMEAAATLLQKEGHTISGRTCLLHRGDPLSNKSGLFVPLFVLPELGTPRIPLRPRRAPAAQRLDALIKRKASRLCWSADVTNTERFETVLQAIAPSLVVLKLHPYGACPVDPARLTLLRIRYDFLVLLDLKFNDIDKTVQAQWSRLSPYEPDFVTATLNAGLPSLQPLIEDDVGVLLVASMSTNPHSADAFRLCEALELARFQKNVCGLVSQHRLDPTIDHWVPGIHLNRRVDGAQRYRHPQDCPWAKIVISGRGVHDADKPAAAARAVGAIPRTASM